MYWLNIIYLTQGCTNPGRQVAKKTKLFAVTANIFNPSVWNLTRITELASGNMRWLLYLRKLYAPLIYTKMSVAQQCSLKGWDD